MAGSARLAWALAAVVLLATAVSACGGGDETTGTGTEADSTAAQGGAGDGSSGDSTSGAGAERGEEGGGDSDGGTAGSGSRSGSGGGSSDGQSSGGGSSGPSSEFVTPGGDNSIPEHGSEASSSERAQASQVLETYMQARQAQNQQAACASLSKAAQGQLQDLATAVPEVDRGDSCARILTQVDQRTPASARADTMTGPVASLRVEGDRGFALYHGTEGTDYTIQMEREGGAWKVGALVPYPLT